MTTQTMTVRHRARPGSSLAPDPNRNVAAQVLEGVMLITSAMLVWLLSATFVHPAWSLVTFANYIWLCTFLFRVDARATVLLLGGLIGRASSFVSLIFIEFGSHIPELDMMGAPGPYSSSLFIYMLITYGSYLVAFRLMAEVPGRLRTHPLTSLFDYYANLIGAAVVGFAVMSFLWLLYKGAATGFPLLAGTDRFVFRRYTDTITLYSLNLKTVLLFMLGMVVFRLPVSAPLRIGASVAAASLMAIYFLFGDKFFTQIGGFVSFLTPYLYVNYETVRRRFTLFMIIGASMMAVVSSVTWFIYSAGGSMTPAATMERLSGRIVGQGELWYLQAQMGAPILNWDQQFIDRNVEALTVKEINLYALQQSLGPYYFSNRYAPHKIRMSMLRNAGTVTYTASMEPLGLAVFGWAGLAVLMAGVGFLNALLKIYVAFAITSRSMVSTVFVSYISVQVGSAIAQGTPWTFMSIFSLKWFSIIAAIEIGLFVLGYSQRSSPERRLGMRRSVTRNQG